MKVKVTFPALGYSGRVGDMVFCELKDAKVTYARRYVKPANTAANDRFKAIQKNLWKIHPSSGYKNDLRQYIQIFNQTKPDRFAYITNWHCLWKTMMFELQRLDPTVDLSTLTRQEIYARDLPCISVAAAVSANLLYPVPGWETLVNQF